MNLIKQIMIPLGLPRGNFRCARSTGRPRADQGGADFRWSRLPWIIWPATHYYGDIMEYDENMGCKPTWYDNWMSLKIVYTSTLFSDPIWVRRQFFGHVLFFFFGNSLVTFWSAFSCEHPKVLYCNFFCFGVVLSISSAFRPSSRYGFLWNSLPWILITITLW